VAPHDEEEAMPSRRHVLTSAAASLIGTALAGQGNTFGRTNNDTNSDGTWLTYAVNIEMTWGNLPFLERIKKVKEAGFTHYEFWPWRNKDLDAIARLNKALGLTVSQFSASPVKGFAHGITDPSPDRIKEFEEEISTAVEAAKKLDVKKICVVAGEETPGLSHEKQTAAVIAALEAGAKIVEPAGITIILEPLNIVVDHPRQLVIYSAHAAEILKSVGSPNVKMLFDIYHQQISEGNLTGNIRKYHDLIGYYQLADHPGRHEPTTGEIYYPFVLKTIHDVGYKGEIGLEMSPKTDPAAGFQAVRKVDAEARALDGHA
jgi:hydroxypyruvate isomerase